MPVLLRINYNNSDFIFQVLTEKPSTQLQFEIFFGGSTFLFVKTGNYWMLDAHQDLSGVDFGLMEAIAKALALRFRVSSSKLVG